MTSEFDECRYCLGLASRSAARGITAEYERHLRPHGIRSTQFTILTNLIMRGGTPMTQLAKYLGMDRTTLTRNVALLAKNGWVTTSPDATDARSTVITVTTAGRAIARKALPAWRAAQESLSQAFGATGVAALRKLSGAT